MSMFSDIDWTKKGNSETCISISEQDKNYAKRFSRGHRTFLGPEDEKKWYGTQLHTCTKRSIQRNRSSSIQVKSISALSRGILRRKNNRDTIHFNANDSNTELLVRTTHSANQLSICGAVSDEA